MKNAFLVDKEKGGKHFDNVFQLIWLCWVWFGCVEFDLVVVGCPIKLQRMVISADQVSPIPGFYTPTELNVNAITGRQYL